MEIFGFSNMLGTGLQLLAASQGSKVPPLGGDAGPAEGIGFATKLARTFLSSQKGSAGKLGDAPFQQSASIERPEGYYSKFGKGTQSLSTPQAKGLTFDNVPQLQTAVANLVQNAQNAQMQQLMQTYNVPVTKAVNQPRTQVEPASLRTIGIGA